MNNTGVVTFPSLTFTYNKPANTFSAEASDLQNRHLQPLGNGEYGLAIQSPITGNVVTFRVVETLKDDDQDIIMWKYVPTVESQRKFPSCVGSKVVIFND